MLSVTLTVKKKLCTLIVKIPTLLQQSFVFSVGGAKVFFLQKKVSETGAKYPLFWKHRLKYCQAILTKNS